MIPSDHFVRFYNEVFKYIVAKGPEEIRKYYDRVSKNQEYHCLDLFREKGLRGMYEYWEHIRIEENCDMANHLEDDCYWFEFFSCPSLSKAVDNDAGACPQYCNHCPGWILPIMTKTGHYAVYNLISRTEPRCMMFVYTDKAKAKAKKLELLDKFPSEVVIDNLSAVCMGLSWREERQDADALRCMPFKIVCAENPPFDFREVAIAWARQNGVVGRMSDAETVGKGAVLISIGSLREMLNPVQVGKSCSKSAHFAALSVLRELIRESVIVETYFDRKKGRDGIRSVANGVNENVLIEIRYAALRFKGECHRVKLTFKRFADNHSPTKAYAYHVTKIEVLAGTIGNGLSDTAPNANTPTTNQIKANPDLTGDILLQGVFDVKGDPLV